MLAELLMRSESACPPGMGLELASISPGIMGLNLHIDSHRSETVCIHMRSVHIDRCAQRASYRVRPCVLNVLLSLRAIVTLATMRSTTSHSDSDSDEHSLSECTLGFEVPPLGHSWCSPVHDLDVHFGSMCHSQDVMACIEAGVVPNLECELQRQDSVFVASTDDMSRSQLGAVFSVLRRCKLGHKVHVR